MPFLVLTARLPIDLPFTQKQIEFLNFNVHPNFHEDTSLPLSLNGEVIGLYEKGVIYCNYAVPKGDTFESYLAITEKKPKKIIFIDDRMGHVVHVGKMAERLGFEYVGVRFGGADERVEAYRHDIAELQYKHLPELLSDSEALQLLNH